MIISKITSFIKSSKDIFIIALVIGVGVLIYFLLQKPSIETIKVKVPVVMEVEVPQKVYTFPPAVMPEPKTVKPRPKIVEQYHNSNQKEKDSLFELLSAVRTYVETYKSDDAEVEVISEVQGFLLKQTPMVKVYPDTIIVKDFVETTIQIPKRNKFYIGAQMGGVVTNIENLNPIFGVSGAIQNKKDRILSVSYNTENILMFGYMFKL